MTYTAVFDHTVDRESDRLTDLGEAINDGTFGRLARLGIKPDARCLDIGSGTGSVARHLAALCPDGEVVATDLDVRHLQPATQAGLRVLRHDVAADDFPQGSFDLIVARWVFAHLPRRGEVLARVAGWLAPGGCLLIEDPAHFAIQSSHHSGYREVSDAVTAILAHLAGTDTGWSRTFPTPLVELGLERVGLAADLPVTGPDTPMSRFLVASVMRIAPELVASGRLTQPQLDQWQAALTSDHFWDLGLANLAAWGYRPLDLSP
jgi:SAM-dependent methyltransferase